MKYLLLLAPFTLLACSQEPAPVDYQGNKYYGRSGVYDGIGNELPKYSASNPAPMPADQSQKYQSSQTYGSPAEIGSVSSSDLPPPSPASGVVDSGISSTSPPAGEIRVPASNAPRTQALSDSGASRAAPFGQATPAPGPSPVAPAQPSTMAAPVEPVTPPHGSNRVTASYPPTASVPEPDYYAQEAAAKPSVSERAMMNSDETAPSAAAPAPVSRQPDFIWPVKGDILSGFGSKAAGKTNDGINIKGLKGDPIRAAADGKVTYAGDDVKALGNMVILDHGNGWITNYAHASEIVVKKGQSVVKGQLLGFVGASGSVSDPQLHFSIRHDNAPTDPKPLLKAD